MRHINRYPQKGMRLTLMLLPFVVHGLAQHALVSPACWFCTTRLVRQVRNWCVALAAVLASSWRNQSYW